MGLVSGSAGFVRYSLDSELPENFWEFAAEQMDTAYTFERLGWQPKYDFRDVERDPKHPTQ